MLERTRKRCKQLRDRYYPPEVRPGPFLRKVVMDAGGADRVCLEIGCGRRPYFLKSVSEAYAFCVGIDVEIQEVFSPAPHLHLVCADANSIPLCSKSIDAVVVQHVMEHLALPRSVFRECARVLRPDGRIIVLTVNKWFPPILISRLMPHRLRQTLNRLATGTEDADTFPAYYRANAFHVLNRIAQDVGLRPVELRYLSNHPEYLMFCVTLYRIGVYFERMIERLDHLQWLRPFIYAVYQKQSDRGHE